MDINLKPSAGDPCFNWNDIEVGDYQLNHSENFFATKHIKHEKFSSSPNALAALEDQMFALDLENKENEVSEKLDHNQNQSINKLEVPNIPKGASPLKDKNDILPNLEAETNKMQQMVALDLENKENEVSEKLDQNQHQIIIKMEGPNIPNGASPLKDKNDILPNLEAETKKMDETAAPSRPPLPLALQWSTDKRVVQTHSKQTVNKNSAPPTPHAYGFKAIYEQKKAEALRKKNEEERQLREFQARAVPDFRNIHHKAEMRNIVHRITVPETPKVLKHSREMEQKKNQKLEEIRAQQQPTKIKSRAPNVLKEPPFVPKKINNAAVQPAPFNLRSEKRAQERKKYDEEVQRAIDNKKMLMYLAEEERKRKEEMEIKQYRKMATFKARPNPFKFKRE